MIITRRIYDPEQGGESYRVFVDKLWPRGLSKQKALWDEWIKEIAPSDKLRKWFSHDPAKWDVFKQRYKDELHSKVEVLDKLKKLEKDHGTITLLYAAKNKEHNNAIALQEILTD